MEPHLEFDEDYHFANQLVSCASSSGSFSTASSCSGPHTPVSGRSTPQRQNLKMEHGVLTSPRRLGYEIATPNSTLASYFPHSGIKNEFHPLVEYDISATTPCWKSSVQAQQPMEFDYAQMFKSFPPQAQVETTQSEVLGGMTYTHHILASPFAPAPAMGSSAVGGDSDSAWSYSQDESMGYNGHEIASILSMKSFHIHDKRRQHVDESQSKSTELHRIQRLQKNQFKRPKRQDSQQQYPGVIKSGTHKCRHPNCINRKAYKRSEHLKRHMDTSHNPKYTQCPFCPKRFNRKDNWKQHVGLHRLRRDKAAKRTEYHPAAEALWDEEERKNKSRSQTKRRKGVKDEEEDYKDPKSEDYSFFTEEEGQ